METAENNKKNALMVEAVVAFAQGCGGAEISQDACAWFSQEYYGWIDKQKSNEKATGRSPQDVWDTEGKNFAGRFQEIGKRAAAASGGGTIKAETLKEEAKKLYQELDCPWCPDRE
jgi:hypothetical protein